MIADATFYVGAVPAVILIGLSKGGFAGLSTLSLPLLALVISPIQAAAIILPILLVQDAVSLSLYWRIWDRLNLRRLLPGAFVGVGLGALLAAYVSDAALQVGIGLISVVFGLRHFLRSPDPEPGRAGIVAGWVWGAFSGFGSMVANAGGPPFQIYVMPQRLERDVFIGTNVAFFAAVNAVKAFAFLGLGAVTAANLATSAVLMPVAVASTYAGVYLARRLSGERFYAIIYALLVLVGLRLLWSGLSA